MNSYGRNEGADHARGVIFFLEEEVREELMESEVYRAGNWEGIKTLLKSQYKWFDEKYSKADLLSLIQKKNYETIHDYVREFERLIAKLEVVDRPVGGIKVSQFLQGLKEADLDELMPRLEDPETGNLINDWAVVEREVGKLEMRRRRVEQLRGSNRTRTTDRVSENASTAERQNRENRPVPIDPVAELTRQFADLRVHLQEALQRPSPGGQRADRMGQNRNFVARCLYCDTTDHDKRHCPILTEHIRDGLVELDGQGRVCNPGTHQEYPLNSGRGGILRLVEEREERGN